MGGEIRQNLRLNLTNVLRSLNEFRTTNERACNKNVCRLNEQLLQPANELRLIC